MKTKNILGSLFTLTLLAAVLLGCASEEKKQAELQAQAKISKADAARIALAKVPGGTIKEGELEREKGHLIYSFDVVTAGTKDITEVSVDAITGAVIGVETETAADEAKEGKK